MDEYHKHHIMKLSYNTILFVNLLLFLKKDTHASEYGCYEKNAIPIPDKFQGLFRCAVLTNTDNDEKEATARWHHTLGKWDKNIKKIWVHPGFTIKAYFEDHFQGGSVVLNGGPAFDESLPEKERKWLKRGKIYSAKEGKPFKISSFKCYNTKDGEQDERDMKYGFLAQPPECWQVGTGKNKEVRCV